MKHTIETRFDSNGTFIGNSQNYHSHEYTEGSAIVVTQRKTPQEDDQTADRKKLVASTSPQLNDQTDKSPTKGDSRETVSYILFETILLISLGFERSSASQVVISIKSSDELFTTPGKCEKIHKKIFPSS